MSLPTVEQAAKLDLDSMLRTFNHIRTEHSKLIKCNLSAFRHELWQEVAVTTFTGILDATVRSSCELYIESEIDGSRIARNTPACDIIMSDPYLFASLSIGLALKHTSPEAVMYRNNQTYFIVGKDFTTVVHHPDYNFLDVGLKEGELDAELAKVSVISAELVVCYGENFVSNMYTYLDIEYTGQDVKDNLDEESLKAAINFLEGEDVDTSGLRFIKTGISRHFFNQNVIISYCPRGHVNSATVWPTNFEGVFDA